MGDELKTERVQLMMTPSEVKAVDDWSFENRIRGRAEAMRRLIEIALERHAGLPDEEPSSKNKKLSRR
jgi:hypothetical protein